MPANERPDPIFITDAPGIDFLNSIATPVETPIEWLDTGADLLDWLDRAGLVPADVCATFRATALPGELDAVAAAARSLRDWFRVFVRAHQGRPLTNDAIAEVEFLNQVLARDEGFAQIEIDAAIDESDRAELHLHERRRWRSPAALLAPRARAVADVICNESFANIKACEGPACTLYFVDRNRSGNRRWCSMAVCGNRSKQNARRERMKKKR
jgi:predicted RNA-binding Zn ribbon-like protein